MIGWLRRNEGAVVPIDLPVDRAGVRSCGRFLAKRAGENIVVNAISRGVRIAERLELAGLHGRPGEEADEAAVEVIVDVVAGFAIAIGLRWGNFGGGYGDAEWCADGGYCER